MTKKRAKEPTDTERLDWLLSRKDLTVQVMNRYSALVYVRDRQAIDAAMKRQRREGK